MKKNNIIFLGAPGSGKGTFATVLKETYSIPHISTGEILREYTKSDAEDALLIKNIIDSGTLLSNDIMFKLISLRLSQPDCKNGFILDGFPRTLEQAQTLCDLSDINYVFWIDIDKDTIFYRMSGRRVCNICGHTNHISNMSENEVCHCGGEYIQRDDDKNLESQNKRYDTYINQITPIAKFYKSKDILYRITESDKDTTIKILKEILENK